MPIVGYIDDDNSAVPFTDVRAGKGAFAAPLPVLLSMIAGDYDPHDYAALTVSRIAGGIIRQAELLRRHEVYVDWRGSYFAWLGRAVHAVADQESRGLLGQAYHSEVNLTWQHPAGVKIGGRPDSVVYESGWLRLDDYKVTGVYTSKVIAQRGLGNEKPEWVRQLNCYRWLCANADDSPWRGARLTADARLRVIAVYRDWSKGDACPPVEVFTVALATDETVRGWLDAAVTDYLATRDVADALLPPCPAALLWFNARKAVVNRCQNYCAVADLCNQWQIARTMADKSASGQMTMDILEAAAEQVGRPAPDKRG